MAGRNEKGRVSTAGGSGIGHNPFEALNAAGLPAQAAPLPAKALPADAASGSVRAQPNRNRGRVEIRRLTAGRGGKTVTMVSGGAEKEQLAKQMRTACGWGGTDKEGQIEIQGDNRAKVAAILQEAGFRPVLAGG